MKLKMIVIGMHCDKCCESIEAALQTVSGFESCSVTIGLAEIVYDESKTGKSDFVTAVRSAGSFDVERFEAVN